MRFSEEVNSITQLMNEKWSNRLVDFILGKRFCEKCLKKFVKKEYPNQNIVRVKQVLSICRECGKGGACYYITND